MRVLEIQWEGRPLKIIAEKINGTLWVKGPHGIVSYRPEVKVYGKDQESELKDQIRAPMPGKIKKVLAKEGATVSPGQTLVIMEAMKMEFELKSPAKALVKTLQCQADDQVQVGQVLVQLDLNSGEGD